MGQGSKNETVFKLPVEMTLIIGRVSISFFILLLDTIRCIIFITSAKIPKHEGSTSPFNFYGQFPDFNHDC